MASAGDMRICAQASERIMGMLVVGLVPGLKSVASSDNRAGLDQSSRRSAVREAQMERAAWQQRANHVRLRERSNIARVNPVEMVGAGGLEFDSQAGCAAVDELLGVNARREAVFQARLKNAARLSDAERAAVAEYVAEPRELAGRDRRNPALDEQIDERAGAAAKFRRDNVRAEKCGDDIERLAAIEIAVNLQNLQFALEIQAVTALGFEGGGAARGKVAEEMQRSFF